MLRQLGSYLLAHDRNAIIAAFLCALFALFGAPTSFLAVIIVAFVTLRKGWQTGLVVLAWVALPTISLMVLKRFGLFDTLLPRCAVAWLLALVLRKTHSLRLALELNIVLAAVAVLIVQFCFPNVLEWWTDILGAVAKNAEGSRMADFFNVTPDQMMTMMHQLAPFATGLLAAIIASDIFIQLILARSWENLIYHPGRTRSELAAIRIHYSLGFVFILATVALYWGWPWLLDLYPVLVLPFSIAGLSLFHRVARCKKGLIVPLVLMYVALLLFTIPAALFLCLMGLLDSGYDFRKRCLSLQAK